jgi:quercetin dioxygenase-like cupin family protein
MNSVNWSELEWDEVMPGLKRKVLHADGFSVVLLEMAPNLDLPAHAHVHEQATLVQEGCLDFTVQGETRTIGPGDVVRIPPQLEHGVKVRAAPARVIDLFVPQRKEFPASARKK